MFYSQEEAQKQVHAREKLEKRFMMTLTRLLGRTSAITTDCVLEFLLFVQTYGIVELQFLEEMYTEVLFDDEEFCSGASIHLCSVEVIISFK